MSQHKIEIANVTWSKRLSQETNAYACDIVVDGTPIGQARNHGVGGQTIISPRSAERILSDIAATEPVQHRVYEGHTVELKPTADSLVDDAFEDWAIAKEYGDKTRERIVYTRRNAPGIFMTRKVGAAEVAKRLADIQFLMKELRADRIINVMQPREIVDLHRAECERERVAASAALPPIPERATA